MMRPLLLVCCLAGVMAWEAGPTNAQQRPTRAEVWDLKLGAAADTLPDNFTDYACGTNGGPPSVPLRGWKEFRRSRPDCVKSISVTTTNWNIGLRPTRSPPRSGNIPAPRCLIFQLYYQRAS